jgi:hypothetical protein
MAKKFTAEIWIGNECPHYVKGSADHPGQVKDALATFNEEFVRLNNEDSEWNVIGHFAVREEE